MTTQRTSVYYFCSEGGKRMNINYKEVARLKRKGESNRRIAEILSISRNTVNTIIQKITENGFSMLNIEEMEESELGQLMKAEWRGREQSYVIPDYEKLSKEYSKPGVTMVLLWEEYRDECRLSKKQAYQLTQFKKYFRKHLKKAGFTDIIKHKAGEKIEVDWAGTKPRWVDPDSGEQVYGYLFVAVLPFSGYGYAQVYADMKLNSWIKGHISMYEFYGGVSKLLIPDNLKTGVTKNKDGEVLLNKTYEEMAKHYGTEIIPTRVYRAQDKPSVEGMVYQLTMHIIAKMRNYQFYSMEEYNKQLLVELDNFNRKPFQKKDGNRYSIFIEMEKPYLMALPQFPYVMGIWKKAKVASNSCISTGKCHYSVPYQYIGETVDLRIGEKSLVIYYKQTEIWEHALLKGRIGAFSIEPSHMPPQSNIHGEWNSSRYLNWAKGKGPFVLQLVQRLFDDAKVEQTKYRTVHSILKLADKFGNHRLNLACQYALEHFKYPNYQNLRWILINNQDATMESQMTMHESKNHRFLRGSKYYE